MNKKKDVRDKKIRQEKLNKAIALSQIFSLILEIFAVSFIFSMGIGVVSGEGAPGGAAATPAPTSQAPAQPSWAESITSEELQKINKAIADAWMENKFELKGGEYIFDYKDHKILAKWNKDTNLYEFYDALSNYKIGVSRSLGELNIVRTPAPEIPKTFADLGIKVDKGEIKNLNDLKRLSDEDLKKAGITKINDNEYDIGGVRYTFDDSGNIIKKEFAAEEYSILGLTTVKWGGIGHVFGNIIEGATWAAGVWAFVGFLQSIEIIPKEKATAIGQALTAGIMAGKTTLGLIKWLGTPEKAGGGFISKYATEISWGVGLLTFYLVLAEKYKETKEREANVEFKCMAWQAPRGGANCEKCNENPLQPCSEYRCRALGQTCKLINQGTGFERCIDSAPNDVTSPGIKPWKNVLTLGYKYVDVKERPPGGKGPSGMRIVSEEGGCLKAFTPFEFGIITTDIGNVPQPAQCKIDFNHTEKFDDMNYYMDDNNLFVENHSQRVSLPNTDTLNKTFPEIKNDGEYSLYIRCKDGNGNENRDEFVVRFCIDKTPDVTAPIIKTTSIPSGSPVLYNVDNVSLAIYTNEPANCRWSRNDASYSNMENQMSCSNNVWEMNAELLYTCTTTLTGIKNKEENKFYFRCQDLSPQNNTMSQSYPFTLIGTQPLNIIKVSPNGTIGSSTTVATVELGVWTDNGFRNGEATCYFSKTQNEKDYIAMSETGGNIHKQSLDLTEGNYIYYFKCVDLGGNTAYNSTNFSIFVDRYSPTIVRTYKYEDKLIIITDEESKCRYSTESCNFDLSKDEGISMPYDFDASKTHYAEWKADQVYYIKCLDKYNNQPEPTECSLIARPFNMPE